MKPTKLAIALTLFAVAFSISHLNAFSADQIARYLGLSEWNTTVDLEPETFIVEIYTIKNGEVSERIFEGLAAWSKDAARGITIISGESDGNYKFCVLYSGGDTVRIETKIPTFRVTMHPPLPETIGAGDYVLFGESTPEGRAMRGEDIGRYSKGFVLRIKEIQG